MAYNSSNNGPCVGKEGFSTQKNWNNPVQKDMQQIRHVGQKSRNTLMRPASKTTNRNKAIVL